MRWNSPERRTRRSTAVIKWTPRLPPTTAWTSSRMTDASPVSIARPRIEVSRMLRLSGVVMRISGGRLAIRARSSAGVSPERVRTLTSGIDSPAASNRWRSSSRGARRLRRTSVLSALSGETYSTRTCPLGHAPATSLSIAHRKAASVLPLPVGAVTRTCFPSATRGQASRCTSVGSPTLSTNHSRIKGWKGASGASTVPMADACTLAARPAGRQAAWMTIGRPVRAATRETGRCEPRCSWRSARVRRPKVTRFSRACRSSRPPPGS